MRNISKFINFIYGKVKNDDVYELIDKNEIISFDVYDTLLQRDVENSADLDTTDVYYEINIMNNVAIIARTAAS